MKEYICCYSDCLPRNRDDKEYHFMKVKADSRDEAIERFYDALDEEQEIVEVEELNLVIMIGE